MDFKQPKTEVKKYSDLISDIEKGIIRIPKFQREFIWSMDRTAKLLDSILKGYPIGTFILWLTDERMNDVKNIGNLPIPDTSEGEKVQYVLDGQQRITSLFVAYRGLQIRKIGEKKDTDYRCIVVNLDKKIRENDDQVITSIPSGEKFVSLSEVLSFDFAKAKQLSDKFGNEELDLINGYCTAFKTYEFPTVVLRKEDIDSAIEVFTRINTGGQTLTLFEIMSAKTYDENLKFDMQVEWGEFIKELEGKRFGGVSSSVILSLLSLIMSPTKECKRKTILALKKEDVIFKWEDAISALKHSIEYFKFAYRIPVSQLLPYDSLLVPFSYFFFQNNEKKPESDQRRYLEEFFWRVSLSYRYSASTEARLAQDIKRVDLILKNERPDYSDINVLLDSPKTLIDTNFSAGNSYCKAILCLLAYQEPKDFLDNDKFALDNSWLKVASSRNYHHFFPKKHLTSKGVFNSNSLINITLVPDYLNKKEIGSKAPSHYIGHFRKKNSNIKESLNSHFIRLDGFGIENDDYGTFLQSRATLIFEELERRLNCVDM